MRMYWNQPAMPLSGYGYKALGTDVNLDWSKKAPVEKDRHCES